MPIVIVNGSKNGKVVNMTIYNGWISPEGIIIITEHKGRSEKIDKLFKQLGKSRKKPKKEKKEKTNNGKTKDKPEEEETFTLDEMKEFAISEGYVLVEEDRVKQEIIFTHNYKEWNMPAVISDAMKKIVFRYRKELELGTK